MSLPTFPEFFHSLWGYDPFPWQSMLAARVAAGDWPGAIDLPTAAGKTACIDIAVHALAAQADMPLEKRTAPRRIWFVVDRRIVVDEAFSRAQRMARALETAEFGPLLAVAEKLRFIGGLGKPLAAGRLRGGVIRDDGWARLPAQPAVLTSTVDQIGSRLLFRGYGQSDSLSPIHAALAGNDSLILLDEAHCSNPFRQTLQAVQEYRGPRWANEPLPLPFQCSILSATLTESSLDDRFPRPDERTRALDHPVLHQRARTPKIAELAIAKPPGKPKKNHPYIGPHSPQEDPLVLAAAQRALELAVSHKRHRVAVMVNRVATAEAIHQRLTQTAQRLSGSDLEDALFDPILLTGRMRPRDRECLANRIDPYLQGANPEDPPRPIILVTTQCLEVGADYSFDALISECASFDALRQRFGRLDRRGDFGDCPALVLIRKEDTKAKAVDPIYGTAIAATWKWLNERNNENRLNFSIESMDAAIAEDAGKIAELYIEAGVAPVLLPAHLDLLAQTSPHPDPEPDIDLFIHGKGRRSSEVRVLWRCDLHPNINATDWIDALAVFPPTTRETLGVPLHRLKSRLGGNGTIDEDADVQGTFQTNQSTDSPNVSRMPFLIWRGRDRSQVTRNLDAIRPGDTIVLPSESEEAMVGLGHAYPLDGLGAKRLDIAEVAAQQVRPVLVLRLTPITLEPWSKHPAVRNFFAWIDDTQGDWIVEEIHNSLKALFGGILQPEEYAIELPGDLPEWPEWLLDYCRAFSSNLSKSKAGAYPAGGLYLTLPDNHSAGFVEEDPYEDEDDLASRLPAGSTTLAQHTSGVLDMVVKFANHCLPGQFLSTFEHTARCHDLGKLDPRFQLLLYNGDEVRAATGDPLAKSDQMSLSAQRRQSIRAQAGLPRGFRHEQLSVKLMRCMAVPENVDPELSVHLCAGHHGFARPFQPAVEDLDPPEIKASKLGLKISLSADKRKVTSPEQQSETLQSFTRLNRRYGWWGLAMLEATFRLADWHASRFPKNFPNFESPLASLKPKDGGMTATCLDTFHETTLTGLDGANPLAYLAAIGTLRSLALQFGDTDVLMRWIPFQGGWRPQLLLRESVSNQELFQILQRQTCKLDIMFSEKLLEDAPAAGPKNKKGERRWQDKLVFPVANYREYLSETVKRCHINDRERVDWAACWAGETLVRENQKVEVATKTRFDFTAGQQAFIGMLRDLREKINNEKLSATLFGPWEYSESASSLRWDPIDEKRQYALQAFDPTNPSANPSLADAGANFLAIQGLAFYPFVADRGARQPGFSGGRGYNRHFHWPLWTTPLCADAVRFLLGHINAVNLSAPKTIGVEVLLHSAIVQPSGRYRCFTPASAV